MNWFTVMGIAATFAFLFPIVLIVYMRLFNAPSLLALLINYSLTCIYNMMVSGMIPASKAFIHSFGIVTNYLDIPTMLLVLLFFSPAGWKGKTIRVTLVAFLVFEAVTIFIKGFTVESILYILGPGIIIILIYSLYLFVFQIKDTIVNNKRTGRSLMIASIFFSYGCNSLVYYFDYVVSVPERNDIFLLFFISSSVSALLMSLGLILMNKRLQQLRELQNTRKELRVFFNS